MAIKPRTRLCSAAQSLCSQMVKLCWAHGLYDAIFYVYNRGMRDYTTPLEVRSCCCFYSSRWCQQIYKSSRKYTLSAVRSPRFWVSDLARSDEFERSFLCSSSRIVNIKTSALETKSRLSPSYMAMVTNAGQQNWRQIHISMVLI